LETTGTELHKDSVEQVNSFLNSIYTQKFITRLNARSYCAKLPWRENHPPLSSNYSVYLQRTHSIAKHLAQTTGVLQLYDSIIQDQVHRGFIEQVDISNTEEGEVYRRTLLPHPSEWCMIVATANPDFRTHNFGVSTDIEKAFLHIYLHMQDRDLFFLTD